MLLHHKAVGLTAVITTVLLDGLLRLGQLILVGLFLSILKVFFIFLLLLGRLLVEECLHGNFVLSLSLIFLSCAMVQHALRVVMTTRVLRVLLVESMLRLGAFHG